MMFSRIHHAGFGRHNFESSYLVFLQLQSCPYFSGL